MKTFKQYLIILSILSTILANCKDGCLRCGPTKKCLFCDFQQGYYLKEGACEKLETNNCTNFSLNGNCSLCNEEYFVDSVSKKCVKVETFIENCKFYDSASQCNTCKESHYVLNGKCLKLEDEISNCKLYYDKLRCLECVTNYELQSDLKNCEKSPESRNCSIFSNLNCKECSNGYLENENYYLDVFFSFQITDTNSVVNYVNSTKNGRGDAIAPNKCQELKTKNCLVSETANLCSTCNPGYFLDSSKACIQNPEKTIDNCDRYATRTTCQQCQNGYYLKTSELCEPQIIIPNCLNYNPTEQSTCLLCISTYYLQTNKCNLREQAIEHCPVLENTSDNCQKCQEGFALTTDKLKCFPQIPNCVTYSTNSKIDTSFTCTKCGFYFYLDFASNSCLGGGVDNCEEYGSTVNSCNRCANLYFLENGVCVLHPAITSCTHYDFVQKSICTACDVNHVLFEMKNGCKAVNPIVNCLGYSSTTNCSSCADGFILSNGDTSCDSIAEELNCLQMNNTNGCTKCKPGYFISGLVCKTYKEYQKMNCAKIANNGMNVDDLNCEKCLPYFYAHDYSDNFVCVLETRLTADLVKIANCLKHETSGTNTKCDECMTGYFRNAAGTCETCATGLKVDYDYTLTTAGNNKTASVIRKNQCHTADADCAVKTMSVLGDQVCLSCNAGKAPVFTNKKTLVNPDIAWDTTVKSLGTTWFAKTCTAVTGTPTYYPGGANVDSNCESYKKVTDDPGEEHYLCVKCAFRKTGNVAEQSLNMPAATIHHYLNCSVEVAGCENDYYGGFHISSDAKTEYNIDSLKEFTCHNCADEDHVIFTYLDMDSSEDNDGYKPFGMDENAVKAVDSLNKVGNVVSCREISATGLGFTAENFTATFTANCQFAFFNINKTKEFKTTTPINDLPIRCVECKPGFSKVLDADGRVLGCNPIENCDNNHHERWINSCSGCLEGFSWKWDNTNNKILYNVCISNNQQEGCLAYSVGLVTGTTRYCKFCKKGYIFNKDGLCEKIIAPKCDMGHLVTMDLTFNTQDANYNELYLIEYLLPNGIGCTKCNIDYLPHYKKLISPLACTKSPYLESRDLIASTNYVKYCEDYSGNSNTCLKCFDNYLPTQDAQTCLPKENFTNCTIVNNNKTECHTCESTSYLRKKNCELRLIPNCQNYVNNSDDMKCETCVGGYYTSADGYSCVMGKLSNCVMYDNSGTCTQCGEKFGLVSLNGGKVYCLELSEDLYCNQANSSKLSIHQFECTSCFSNYVLTTVVTEYAKSDCFKITEISNCANHNLNSSLNTSTLRCDKCVENFFVAEDGLECRPRSSLITNCLFHSDTAEICDECQLLFYRSDDKKKCIPIPIGIKYCKEYNSLTECSKCENGYFIQGGICAKLADDKIIPSCIEYEVNDTTVSCSRCNTNFLKDENGLCQRPIARNCATYKNLKECLTCPEGYIFTTQKDISVTECIIHTITNCFNLDPETSLCKKCLNGYYINKNGKCSAVPIDIKGCLFYENKENCSKCEKERVLSKDKKTCFLKGLNNTNPMNNCEEIVYLTDLTCVTCKEGFFFKNGECEKCVTSLEQGCYACDYRDSSSCLMCVSGFHQEEEGKPCVRNEVESGGGGGDVEVPVDFGFGNVLRSLVLVVFVVIY